MPKQPIPLHEYQPRRIVLIKPSALGDIVHSLPVLTALRHRYPAAHITWVVNSAYEPLLRGHPDLDATLTFNRGAGRAGLLPAALNLTRFLRQLRSQRFDLAIDLQNLLRSGIMAAASGAARRVGLASARECAACFYTDIIPVDQSTTHAVDRYWRVAEALGAGEEMPPFHVPLRVADLLWVRQLLDDLPRPWMLLGVGSRWQTKRWPPEHFALLAGRAQERFGGTVILVGSRDEMAGSRLVARRLRGPWLDLTARTSLPQLAAVLSLADVMVANDTGPLHLSVALGRPVVAPYTCTKVIRTGPYRQENRAVEAPIWCQGSYLKRCPRLECMTQLLPEHLWPALHEVLEAWESKRQSA